MKDILSEIGTAAIEAIHEIYHTDLSPELVAVTPTSKEHTGDYTLVTFSLAKALKQAPPVIAQNIGAWLTKNRNWVERADVVQGFLNISLRADFWSGVLNELKADPDFWKPVQTPERILVEFSSPNTNKPLHLGHIRNILLGWSMYKIYSACGHDVKRVQIVNDRGIAICKSMVAWKNYSGGQTPESIPMKSDHFVGEWYVRFEKEFSAE
ncbi:MAG TPA: arginine--tRNA ligase, partial [Saprospiraceae bacterium]|nr:arginine--tRNA ligase [Saprospiraceae bacterium]